MAFENAVLSARTALESESSSSADLRARRDELAGWQRKAWDELEGEKTHGSRPIATSGASGPSVCRPWRYSLTLQPQTIICEPRSTPNAP